MWGGPSKYAGCFNLNLAPLENVDIVGMSERLPFSSGSVDALCYIAVLEHVRDLEGTFKQIQRCLKQGGLLILETPFLQAFHGYPNHYRGLTIEGQVALCEDNGLEVLSSFVTTGPVSCILSLLYSVPGLYFPNLLGKIVRYGFQGLTFWLKYMDLLLPKNVKPAVYFSSAVFARKK